MHQFANIKAILNFLTVFSKQLHFLLFHHDLISLVVLEVTSVNHPEIEVYIQLKYHIYEILAF